jgi:DNA-binding transcriptional MerR regulator
MAGDELLGIGEFASRTRMSVSALRFYADAGVLTPADVDAHTGYRRYATSQIREATILRELRAAGMPLADASRILRAELDTARQHLDAWQGEVDATHRRSTAAIARLHGLFEKGMSMTAGITLTARDWREAVRQVLPATARNDERPVLMGVLVDVRSDALRLVTTDSHRLAIRDVVPDHQTGEATTVVVAGAALADQVQPRTERNEPVQLTVTTDELRIDNGDQSAVLTAIASTFPDYQVLVDAAVPVASAIVDRVSLITALADIALDDVVRLALASNELSVGTTEAGVRPTVIAASYDGEPAEAALQPRYLLDALVAVRSPEVLIDLAGPLNPLRIRAAGSGSFATLIMPVRVD